MSKSEKTKQMSTKFTFFDTVNLIKLRHSRKYKELFKKVEEVKTQRKQQKKTKKHFAYYSDTSYLESSTTQTHSESSSSDSNEDIKNNKFKDRYIDSSDEIVNKISKVNFTNFNNKGNKRGRSSTKHLTDGIWVDILEDFLVNYENDTNEIDITILHNKYYSLNRKYLEEIEKIARTNKRSTWTYFEIFDKTLNDNTETNEDYSEKVEKEIKRISERIERRSKERGTRVVFNREEQKNNLKDKHNLKDKNNSYNSNNNSNNNFNILEHLLSNINNNLEKVIGLLTEKDSKKENNENKTNTVEQCNKNDNSQFNNNPDINRWGC